MKTSIPKLRRVRFKSGQSLEVLRQYPNNDRQSIEKRLGALMDGFFKDGIGAGGFAFVIWDKSGASSVAQSNFGGCVSVPQIPDFAKTRLLLNTAEAWTMKNFE